MSCSISYVELLRQLGQIVVICRLCEYHVNEFVTVGFQEDDLPIFIDIIVTSGNIPMLAVQYYQTKGINTHIAAYQIFCTSHTSVVFLPSLVCKHPLSSHQYSGDGFVDYFCTCYFKINFVEHDGYFIVILT